MTRVRATAVGCVLTLALVSPLAAQRRVASLDAATGNVVWNTEVANPLDGYSLTAAPLVVNDLVITGIAGGEFGIRGFVDAYDAKTGARRWRTYMIPGEGEPGNDTWEADSWTTGGASTWQTGAYDPALNLVYWGVGNPGPDWNGETSEGDNLYSDSVVAMDDDTGEIRWHFQFTPHDVHDWDACNRVDEYHSAIRAIDPTTGARRWEFSVRSKSMSGVMATAGGLVFTGTVTGNFIALDAETGADLWRRPLGGEIIAAPMTDLSNDRQHVTIAAGHAIFTFTLPD